MRCWRARARRGFERRTQRRPRRRCVVDGGAPQNMLHVCAAGELDQGAGILDLPHQSRQQRRLSLRSLRPAGVPRPLLARLRPLLVCVRAALLADASSRRLPAGVGQLGAPGLPRRARDIHQGAGGGGGGGSERSHRPGQAPARLLLPALLTRRSWLPPPARPSRCQARASSTMCTSQTTSWRGRSRWRSCARSPTWW